MLSGLVWGFLTHTLWLFYSTYTEIKLCHSKRSPNPIIIKLGRLSLPIHFCQQRWLSISFLKPLQHTERKAWRDRMKSGWVCISLRVIHPYHLYPRNPLPSPSSVPTQGQTTPCCFYQTQCNPKGMEPTASLVQAEQDSAQLESSLQNRRCVAPLTW